MLDLQVLLSEGVVVVVVVSWEMPGATYGTRVVPAI